jgi:hypothetical protein
MTFIMKRVNGSLIIIYFFPMAALDFTLLKFMKKLNEVKGGNLFIDETYNSTK